MSVPAVRPHTRPTTLREFLYGVTYYPEHWDEDVRAGDPALFHAAGYNVVRMAEFAWDRMEPEEGRFDFALLDETIARLGAVGIRAILCTPTATPPVWLTRRHPEVLRVDDRGVAMQHGSRQHASHFSPEFRAHSRRITRAMAGHFAANSHVIGWQTDNEMHCHFSEDHGPAAQAEFTRFLRERFADDVEALNRAWGTAFWAQTYRSFDEVPTPRAGLPAYANPAHLLDYHRFLAGGAAAFQRDQVEILRAANAGWFVTHNGMFRFIDYAGEFGADLDFHGYDAYPFFRADYRERAAAAAANTDHVRALGGNFLVLEQQSGPGGQGDYLHDTPAPGDMRRHAYGNIARGADGILFFRERSCRFGAEEFWCGVLDHDNVPRRRYREAAQFGAELARVGPAVIGTSVHVDVAIAGGDLTNDAGHLSLSHGLPVARRVGETIHTHFYGAGHAIGWVHPADDLTGLRAYFVPHLALLDPAWVPAWTAWVEAGGVLVVGARTGSKDRNNNVIAGTWPGALRALAGVRVEEFGRQNRPDLRPMSLDFGGGIGVPTEWWYEVLESDGEAEVVARWCERHVAGLAAVTRRRFGRGAVYYVGTYFTSAVTAAVADLLAADGWLPEVPSPIPGVERTHRVGPGRALEFVINHNEEPVTVSLAEPGHDLVADRAVEDTLTLAAGDVAVIERER